MVKSIKCSHSYEIFRSGTAAFLCQIIGEIRRAYLGDATSICEMATAEIVILFSQYSGSFSFCFRFWLDAFLSRITQVASL